MPLICTRPKVLQEKGSSCQSPMRGYLCLACRYNSRSEQQQSHLVAICCSKCQVKQKRVHLYRASYERSAGAQYLSREQQVQKLGERLHEELHSVPAKQLDQVVHGFEQRDHGH